MKKKSLDIIIMVYIILGFVMEFIIRFSKYVSPDIRFYYYGIIGTPLVLYTIIKNNKHKLN